MKCYFELTDFERTELDEQGLSDAIRLESIHRGIAPPITLNESLKQGLYASYHHPADYVKFYEIMRPSKYSGQDRTGLAFATEQEAINAIQGAFAVVDEGYGNSKPVLVNGSFSVQVVTIGSQYGTITQSGIKEYNYEEGKYKEVVDECVGDLQEIRQRKYNLEVNKLKVAEYLRLAGGSESIARAFWAKTESIEWPVIE